LAKVEERLLRLAALMVVFLNVDEVIRIIREEDQPKPVLMERFDLVEVQAEYILETKLRQLARLEEMKILEEQQALEKERDNLKLVIASERRMKTLVKKELIAAADEFGDARRSPIKVREEAQAFSELDLLGSEPVTVVISDKGWIRAAKGHEVDPTSLNYKAGDSYKLSARGKTNQNAILLDSTGRTYALAVHTLPSARGQGEPISGRLNPQSGSAFEGLLMGAAEQRLLLASDAGYGFVTKMSDLYTKNKSGKTMLSLPKGGRVLAPIVLANPQTDLLVAISNEGRLLVFPVSELPELARGKGNKIMNIPSARVQAREEYLVVLQVVSEGQQLVVYSGKRHLSLKGSDLDHYLGERGRRGNKLPRGFQNVDRAEVQG